MVSAALLASALCARRMTGAAWLTRTVYWYPALTGLLGGALLLLGAYFASPARRIEASAALFGAVAGVCAGALQHLLLRRAVVQEQRRARIMS